ncbi:hypothetical protein OSB04_006043 [Centaurea solstitialis]|uniref:F-box domain-containing protein n=1 Tax=Centaurea solstitialis TaxID=347529 RepID=A0AA38TPR6_9ASTR|nr:hypothetical protein OSB04_006043 [Centaurea solstitialis]
MPSTSKSNREKPKEQQTTWNWLELPSDVMANILLRVGIFDILENVEKVCTAWRKICKDPSMWRVICVDSFYQNSIYKDDAMCRLAVDRSQGQLIDITIGDFGTDELLQYVADRSSELRCLKIIHCYDSTYRSWTEELKKFPLLEELSLFSKYISKEVVETVGCYCPLLKTLKLNKGLSIFYEDYVASSCDKIAIAIGENLHELEHLELIGNNMSNIGLQAILDGCHHLKSLDLRWCCFVDLNGDLGKRCSQQLLPVSKKNLLFGHVSETRILVIRPPVAYGGFHAVDDEVARVPCSYVCFVCAKVTMPSTSRSKGRKSKRQWKQPREPTRNWLELSLDVTINIFSRLGVHDILENAQKVCTALRNICMKPTRNWLELPSDVTINILSRLGVHDILENVQIVCTAWQKICKDPSLWRVICMDYPNPNSVYKDVAMRIDGSYAGSIYKDIAMCKHAVDRSRGQLIDITIGDFGNDELLQYVADRSSQLRRLKIICCYPSSYRSWAKVLKKFPLLEELSLYSKQISTEVVETVGRHCPQLKTLKLNEGTYGYIDPCDKIAITIGENLHELEHLELIGNCCMSNVGLEVILDGCRHLKSLDLRMCRFIDLEGALGKRCSQQIKCLKLPDDSLEGSQYIYGYDSNLVDDSDNEYFDYDPYN